MRGGWRWWNRVSQSQSRSGAGGAARAGHSLPRLKRREEEENKKRERRRRTSLVVRSRLVLGYRPGRVASPRRAHTSCQVAGVTGAGAQRRVVGVQAQRATGVQPSRSSLRRGASAVINRDRATCQIGTNAAPFTMIVSTAVLLALVGFSMAANQVPVTVYYESLCPDSIDFYVKQLYPTMSIPRLAEYVDLNLVPYGKSTTEKGPDGSLSFTCHHGERECYGNKVHACALKYISSKNERLSYLNCLLKSMRMDRKIVFPADKCAEDVHVDKKAILNCANGTESGTLLEDMGKKTGDLEPKLTSVPTVVFNNTYKENDFKQAQVNFKGVLCKYIPAPKPEECDGASGTGSFNSNLIVIMLALYTLFSFY